MSSPRRVTIRNQATGEMEEGTRISIVQSNEPFSRYKLDNGTEIEIRIALAQVVLLDKPGGDGKPNYNINAQLMMNVHHGEPS